MGSFEPQAKPMTSSPTWADSVIALPTWDISSFHLLEDLLCLWSEVYAEGSFWFSPSISIELSIFWWKSRAIKEKKINTQKKYFYPKWQIKNLQARNNMKSTYSFFFLKVTESYIFFDRYFWNWKKNNGEKKKVAARRGVCLVSWSRWRIINWYNGWKKKISTC